MNTYKIKKIKRNEKINEVILVNLKNKRINIIDGNIENFAIGLYTGSKGKYFIQFSLKDTGYTSEDGYLNSDTGYTNGYRNSNGEYLLSRGSWSHGLYNNNCIYNIGKFLENIPSDIRKDPYLCSRYVCCYISKPTNYHNPVLTGNWGGISVNNFGKSLVNIMQNYTNNRVTYGQCFTFSGVLAGICRHIGIPCAQIVVTDCAHNSIHSQQTTLVNENFGDGKTDNNSMVWNFHSFNEIYLKNPNSNICEWFVLDATAQEVSNCKPLKGNYVCGPCPVLALSDPNAVNDENKYFDINYISTETRGNVSHGVEYYNRQTNRKPLHIYYYRDHKATGTAIYKQNTSCTGFYSVKDKYKCKTPFPEPNFNIEITQLGFNKKINITGSNTGNLEAYIVCLRTNQYNRRRNPSYKDITYYKVRPLPNFIFSGSEILNNYFTHIYIVVGNRVDSFYNDIQRLINYKSLRVK